MTNLRNILNSLQANNGLLYISLGNILGAVLTGVFWLLLATVQTVDDYGKTNYLVAISSLACFVGLLGLNTTVTNFTSELKKISVQANQLTLIVATVASVFISVAFGWHLGLFVLSMVFWMMSSYELLGKKMYKQYALVIIGARGLQFGLSFPLYFIFGIDGIVMSFVASFFAFSYRYFASIREFDFKFDQLRGKMKFSLHAYAFNMSTAFLLYFDKLIILPLFGYAVLGYYQISLQFLLFVGMIPISLYQYLLSSESADSEKSKLRVLGLGISVILAALLFVASPWLIQQFFPNFTNSIDALRIASVGIIPMTMVWTINSRLFKIGKSKFVAIGSAIYLSVQITLIYFLGHLLGVMGLAIALDIALTTQAAFLYFCQKRVKMDLSQ